MRRSRLNYWSCSRFADWVRGEKKPLAMEWGGWESWRRDASARKPFRFFVAEEVLDRAQDFLMLPWDLCRSFSSWWDNRFVSKTHFLKTGLEPGVYHELDTRMLHGLFNELQEFVEVDLALANCWGENKGRYKFVGRSCPAAGLDHLNWAAGLRFGEDEGFKKGDPEYGEPTPQARAAATILDLYRWWTVTRPDRSDLHEASGWEAVWDSDDEKAKRAASRRLQRMEDLREREDERMLVRLVRVRRHLWT